MAYRPISIVNISLQDKGVTGLGFGTPIFIAAHRYFKERVRAYTSIESVAEDIPVDSPTYKGALAFFSNSPAPSAIKIGRREADLDLTVATGSTSASFILTASDGTDQHSVTVNVTSQVDEDAVATAIASAIEGDVDVGALVVATASLNVVSIDVANSAYSFWISNLSDELSEDYNTTETAGEVLAAIEQEDQDFYFVTAEDHSETFVLAMAAAVEARTKVYALSVQQSGALTPYVAGSATDIIGKIKDIGYERTICGFANDADSTFPECSYIGYNAPYVAGSVSWDNITPAIAITKDTNGNKLTATQKGYLVDRSAFFVEVYGGVNVLKGGRTASGSKIDFIHGRDNLESDMNIAYMNLLVNQKGGKIPFNDSGINQLATTCTSVLYKYVQRGFINAGFEKYVVFPPASAVSAADKAAGIYKDGRFKAELTGSVDFIGEISGNLSIVLQ